RRGESILQIEGRQVRISTRSRVTGSRGRIRRRVPEVVDVERAGKEDSVAAANRKLAVPERIPYEAEARSEVLIVRFEKRLAVIDARILIEPGKLVLRIHGVRIEVGTAAVALVRRLLIVVAESHIHVQCSRHAPGILYETAERVSFFGFADIRAAGRGAH